MAFEPDQLLVCHECDAVQCVRNLRRGGQVRCFRCNNRLIHRVRRKPDKSLALMVTTLILFLVANLMPMLTIEVQGTPLTTTISGAALAMWEAGHGLLAAVVLFGTVVGPGLEIVAQIYVLIALYLRVRLPGVRLLLLAISRIDPWGMMDVFLLGVIVALVKLIGMAAIVPGPGLLAFVALIPLFAYAEAQLEVHQLWDRWERLGMHA